MHHVAVVEDLRTSLQSSSVMMQSAASQSLPEEEDETPPTTMTAQSRSSTPFTSVMIGSMTTSLWASANNTVLDSTTIDPIHVHQVLHKSHSRSVHSLILVPSFLIGSWCYTTLKNYIKAIQSTICRCHTHIIFTSHTPCTIWSTQWFLSWLKWCLFGCECTWDYCWERLEHTTFNKRRWFKWPQTTKCW